MSTACNMPQVVTKRLGKGCNLCIGAASRHSALRSPEVLTKVVGHLGGLDLAWPRPLPHPQLPHLPAHLPVLVQAYADPLSVPWVVLHGGRVLGVAGSRITPKHRQPPRDMYRLPPTTRVALELYVEDRVLEGLWAQRKELIPAIRDMGFDFVLSPNFSVWRDACRVEQVIQIKRSFAFYHELVESGVIAIPDVGFSFFEPDGRLWADWINGQQELQAISLFCGGRKINAEKRALRETLEDIALLHEAVRHDVAFVLGGVHSAERLAQYRRAAPMRRLVCCNGMAYAMAQRRKLLDPSLPAGPRSTRECFLLNCAHNDRVYTRILRG
jgi:hypothetical protein